MKLEELFSLYAGKRVCVLMNVGNKGDGLIHAGGRELFSKYHINYTEISYPEDVSGDTLFVYGCGGFSLPYHHMVEFINFYIPKFRSIYILPSSFDVRCREVRDFITHLPINVKIYCREKYSYDELKSLLPFKDQVFMDKDMAFHYDYSRWKKKGDGVLIAFRSDDESVFSIKILRLTFERFIKIICILMGKSFSCVDVSQGSEKQCEAFLEKIASYQEIYTDRAHASIAGAMMGKVVYMFPSRYHKQKGIYEYSLSGLPSVHWANRLTEFIFNLMRLI